MNSWNWCTRSPTQHHGGISKCNLSLCWGIGHSNSMSSLASGTGLYETVDTLGKILYQNKEYPFSIFTIAAFLGDSVYVKTMQINK